jgi:hypothetical protein
MMMMKIIIIIIIMYVNRCCHFRRQKCDLKIQRHNRNTTYVERKNKSDTSNNRGEENHEVKELKKIAILGTAYILRKVLT